MHQALINSTNVRTSYMYILMQHTRTIRTTVEFLQQFEQNFLDVLLCTRLDWKTPLHSSLHKLSLLLYFGIINMWGDNLVSSMTGNGRTPVGSYIWNRVSGRGQYAGYLLLLRLISFYKALHSKYFSSFIAIIFTLNQWHANLT